MRIWTRQRAARRWVARVRWLLVLAGILLVAGITALELWTALPDQLLPARERTVAVLHWAKEHWLNASAITALGTVVAALVPLLIWWLGPRGLGETAKQRRQARQRTVMLKRVRHKWITGVLEPSLAHAARLAIGLERRPGILDPGARAVQRPGRPPESLSPGTPIIEVFEKVGGGLLILGAPGAGKTTLLLQLAEELLNRAEQDPGRPIPVVVNLASWANRRQPLTDWLAEELSIGYTVPKRIAAAWVEQDALVLLLDGLDEIAAHHRAACAATINDYRHEHGLVELALCSRTQELWALPIRLSLDEAVELQPLTDTQIATYFDHVEATGTPLEDVRAALDTDEELRTLLRTPLMLNVIALAFAGRPALALHQSGGLVERQARPWESYVERMFEQRPLHPSCGYTVQQAVGWLSWLARTLRNRDQVEFYLDRLTVDWLPTPAHQRHARLMVGLAVGPVFGSFIGLFFGLAFGLWIGRSVGLGVGLFFGLWYGVATVLEGWPGSHEPAEELQWSWDRFAIALGMGLLVGLPSGLVFGLVLGWAIGLFLGLLLGLSTWLFGWLDVGVRATRSTPNEGIKRSGRYALFFGLAGSLIVWVAAWMAGGLHVGLIYWLAGGLVYGSNMAMSRGLETYVRHYAIRVELYRAGVAPWRYESFLTATTERLLMRRSGSAYLFIHRLLRDYLADRGVDSGDLPSRDVPAERRP